MKKRLKRILAKVHRLDRFTKNYREVTGVAEIPLIAYANWGKYLTDIQDFDGAEEKLKTAILMYNSNPLPYINLGIIYAKRRKYEEAKSILEKALKLDSNNKQTYSLLCGVYVELKQYKNAEEILKIAQKQGAVSTDLYINYSIALAKQKKFHKAIEQMKKCKEKDITNVTCSFLLALFYLDSGKAEDAFSEFRFVKYAKEDYPLIDYYLGYCLAKLKNYKSAYHYALKEYEKEKNNPALYILLAECSQRLGYYDNSNRFYSECKSRGFESEKLYYSWGCSLLEAGKTEDAAEKFLLALRFNPENITVIHKLAQCFIRTKNYNTAEEFCLKALSLNSDFPEAYSDLGFIKYNQNQYEDALKNFIAATKISHNFNFLYFYIANCSYKSGKIKESIDYYTKTMEYFPNHTEAYLNYTKIMLELNNTSEALRKIRAAYKLGKKSEKLLYFYALTLYKSGLYYDAAEKTDELLTLNKTHINAKFLKIDSLIKINKAQDAIDLLKEIPQNLHNTAVFIYLNYLAYFSLAQDNPTSYNNNTTLYYYDKMKELYPEEKNWEDTKHYINTDEG